MKGAKAVNECRPLRIDGIDNYRLYNAGIIGYTYQCGKCELIPGVSLVNVLMWITQVMVVIILLGYIIVIISVRIRRRVQGRHNRFTAADAQLLVQGAIICAFQWLNSFMFFMLPGTADFGIVVSCILFFLNSYFARTLCWLCMR
uniref:G_PROTEIN_RECEP_F1_2 domain-containing protein n=1 Tax=Syphacia muris TaxID=451379 RepID=A0A0N5AG57_9BILA